LYVTPHWFPSRSTIIVRLAVRSSEDVAVGLATSARNWDDARCDFDQRGLRPPTRRQSERTRCLSAVDRVKKMKQMWGAGAMSWSREGKGAASKPPRFEGIVREASEAEMPAAQEIHALYVSTSLATFEETPPTLEEMLVRRKKSIEAGLPYLVAEVGGETVGFAYAAPYHARPAYLSRIRSMSPKVALVLAWGRPSLRRLLPRASRDTGVRWWLSSATARTPPRSPSTGVSASCSWAF
jgi:hypothetical protein